MKLLVATAILALALLASAQEPTSTTESPECVGVKDAVKDGFRTCFSRKRPQGGGSPPREQPRPIPSDSDRNASRACLLEKLQANSVLSEYVSACPEAAQPDVRGRLNCIKEKIEEKCKSFGGRRGGRRGGNRRPGGRGEPAQTTLRNLE